MTHFLGKPHGPPSSSLVVFVVAVGAAVAGAEAVALASVFSTASSTLVSSLSSFFSTPLTLSSPPSSHAKLTFLT